MRLIDADNIKQDNTISELDFCIGKIGWTSKIQLTHNLLFMQDGLARNFLMEMV